VAEILKTRELGPTFTRQPRPGERDEEGRLLFPYLPPPDLIEALRLAMFLERPLLLKGDPGSGKTRLARAVAYELDLPYEEWHIKSTSRARDGLYTYDAIGRLHDAQLAASGQLSPEDLTKLLKKLRDPSQYVHWGPLGRAFRNDRRTVVLIDEIDKADIDFPNDLLLELDERRFLVEETGEEVRARTAPVILITSNDEKDLPDAFLRRCLFYFIIFPEGDQLIDIIKAHFPETPEDLVKAAVHRFEILHGKMVADKGDAGKRVSTSELIDWFRVLSAYPEDKALSQLDGTLPFPSVLLKSFDDHRRYLSDPELQGRAREP
jgi:MoxR-like ATPase